MRKAWGFGRAQSRRTLRTALRGVTVGASLLFATSGCSSFVSQGTTGSADRALTTRASAGTDEKRVLDMALGFPGPAGNWTQCCTGLLSPEESPTTACLPPALTDATTARASREFALDVQDGTERAHIAVVVRATTSDAASTAQLDGLSNASYQACRDDRIFESGSWRLNVPARVTQVDTEPLVVPGYEDRTVAYRTHFRLRTDDDSGHDEFEDMVSVASGRYRVTILWNQCCESDPASYASLITDVLASVHAKSP